MIEEGRELRIEWNLWTHAERRKEEPTWESKRGQGRTVRRAVFWGPCTESAARGSRRYAVPRAAHRPY